MSFRSDPGALGQACGSPVGAGWLVGALAGGG